jgi:multicomponent Na+:H+ antiporter subunit E
MTPLLRPWSLLLLMTAFARDLVLSSLQVARVVVTPRAATAPRFCIVPLASARTGLEVTLVANYITLTPGKLTVDVSPDGDTLLVHSLLAGGSSEAVCADVRAIEARVTRVTR